MYDRRVPKLWNETIEEHRRTVHEAIQETTAALVAEHGLSSVTMSQIAAATGIGRATLYKYFPDVEAILAAWHERKIAAHLGQLADVAAHPTDGPGARLEAVLRAYARIAHERHERHDTELGALLHKGEQVTRAQAHLRDFITRLIADGAKAGELRSDVAPGELAEYCLYALAAAGGLPSQAAVDRLVAVTLTGLRPAPSP